jgi:porin
VFDGGVNQRGSFRNMLLLDAELDLGKAVGLDGGTAYLQYLSVNAETGGSMDAGDIQVYSNVENDAHLDVVYELWYEQRLLDDRFRIKIGKADANSEFAFVDVAGEFANSSAGFSPTLFAYPSFPDSAMSINAFGTVIDQDGYELTLGYGLYDGAAADGIQTGRRGPSTFFSNDRSNAYFQAWQAELNWNNLSGCERWLKDGRFSSGFWYHSGDFERFDGRNEQGAYGFFITTEQQLISIDNEDRGLYTFAQIGLADGSVSEIAGHYAGGLVLRGTTVGRPDDSAGIYLTLADLSNDPAAGFESDEFAIDTYYRIQLAPAIYVQPEFQYIANPSGDPNIDHAIAGGIRVGVTF